MGRVRLLPVQEFRQRRDRLVAAPEPSIHIADRKLVAVDESARQRDERERVRARVLVECVSHSAPDNGPDGDQRHGYCSLPSRIRHAEVARLCETTHWLSPRAATLMRSRRQHSRIEPKLHTDNMEPTEIQARATIAAALILSRAVEIPSIPTSGDWSQDTAALRLRDLTDYVYQMIATGRNR